MRHYTLFIWGLAKSRLKFARIESMSQKSRRLSFFAFGIALFFTYSAIYYQFPSPNVADLGDYFFTQDIDEKGVAAHFHDLLPLAGIFGPPSVPYARFLSLPAESEFLPFPFTARLGCRSPPPSIA